MSFFLDFGNFLSISHSLCLQINFIAWKQKEITPKMFLFLSTQFNFSFRDDIATYYEPYMIQTSIRKTFIMLIMRKMFFWYWLFLWSKSIRRREQSEDYLGKIRDRKWSNFNKWIWMMKSDDFWGWKIDLMLISVW